jgi:hypothetical protein
VDHSRQGKTEISCAVECRTQPLTTGFVVCDFLGKHRMGKRDFLGKARGIVPPLREIWVCRPVYNPPRGNVRLRAAKSFSLGSEPSESCS